MKIILDENIHIRFASFFPNHEVSHVTRAGMAGKKNGELMKLCIVQGFDIFITMDQNLEYQQNLERYDIRIIVIKAINNRLETLEKFVSKVAEAIAGTEKLIVIS